MKNSLKDFTNEIHGDVMFLNSCLRQFKSMKCIKTLNYHECKKQMYVYH